MMGFLFILGFILVGAIIVGKVFEFDTLGYLKVKGLELYKIIKDKFIK